MLTTFFAEFYGLFLILFGLSMLVHKEMYMEIIHDMEHHRATIYSMCVTGLVLGLFTVLLHNTWDGSLLDVIVTIVGWVVLIKSALYLALSNRSVHKIVHAMGLVKNYSLYTTICLIIGIYLAFNGLFG